MKKPGPIDLRSIRYVLAIVEEGSFARAAQKLHLTQPALSRSVQALERELGTKLLDRGPAGVTPTVFGALLVQRGRKLVSDAAAIVREIALIGGGEAGEFTVGVGPYPAEISVGPAAARLLATRPGLAISITHGDYPKLIADVLSETLDLAVCELTGAEENPNLVIEPLPEHRGFLFCRSDHPLAKRKTVTLEEVRQFPLALTTVPARLAGLVTANRTDDRDTLAPAVRVDTVSLVKTIVLGSNAVGAAVGSQLDREIKSGEAVRLPIELPWLKTRYGFIYLGGRTPAPSVAFFMDAVRAIEAELAPVAGGGKRRKRTR